MARTPEHGDTSTCRFCGAPIAFWDANPGNPGHRGEYWFHTGRTYPAGSGKHPNYCSEVEAAPMVST
jgi:hypothetical protein